MLVVDPARKRLVAKLLAAGTLSQRAIARRTGVSRGTVDAMANGQRRADFSRRVAEARPELELEDAAETVQTEAVGNIRCPGCKALITFVPCHACRIRRLLHSGRRPPSTGPEPDEPLTCALLFEDQARYELLRRQKVDELLEGLPAAADRDEPDELEPTVEDLRRIETE